jgi:hypothetical protein
MVAFAIRSASATLPNTRPSAVHMPNHLPGYAAADRLPLIARATLVAYYQSSTGVLDSTIDSIKIFYSVLKHGRVLPSGHWH